MGRCFSGHIQSARLILEQSQARYFFDMMVSFGFFPVDQLVRSHTTLRDSFSHALRRSRSRGSHKTINKRELRSTLKIVILFVIVRSSILNATLNRSGFLCSVIPINRDIFVTAAELVNDLMYYDFLRLTCSHKSSK